MLHSPSFWALVLLLPLVYMIVGSIAGLWGFADWSTDVRASLATAVVSLIVGGSRLLLGSDNHAQQDAGIVTDLALIPSTTRAPSR